MRGPSFSVSNLLEKVSVIEIKAMFYRAGRIVDVFLPRDKSNERVRGFAFVMFVTGKETDRAIDMASGRSWGGRRILVNLARFLSSSLERKAKRGLTEGAAKEVNPGGSDGEASRNAWLKKAEISSR